MGQTLTNGIYLPAEGERNCYEGLAENWTALDGLIGGYNAHVGNATIHVTAADKEAWNGKADASALTAHTGDTTIHVTAADKEAWNGHVADSVKHVTAEDKQAWNGKADASALTAHTGDATIHVTAEDKSKWDAVTSKADDSDVVHKSGNETISGNKTFSSINGVEPSSLSLPGDRSARIDISSYFTNTGSGNTNDYSVPANGFIFLNLLKAFTVICYSIDGTNNVNYAQSYFRPVDGQIYILFPVRKNDNFRTLWTSNGGTITVTGAYFIPCLGNV